MKSDTVRELIVSGFFSSCLAGILANFVILRRNATGNQGEKYSIDSQRGTIHLQPYYTSLVYGIMEYFDLNVRNE